jgi:hypothetical protein
VSRMPSGSITTSSSAVSHWAVRSTASTPETSAWI